jgi:hypothetical protein
MRYDLQTKVGEKIDLNIPQTPIALPGKSRAKRQRRKRRDNLVREFSLNQLIANTRKVGDSLK